MNGERILTFSADRLEPWLTIAPDGSMRVGAGLSEDEATRRVAEMLARNYSQLYRDQAEEISRLREALARARP